MFALVVIGLHLQGKVQKIFLRLIGGASRSSTEILIWSMKFPRENEGTSHSSSGFSGHFGPGLKENNWDQIKCITVFDQAHPMFWH